MRRKLPEKEAIQTLCKQGLTFAEIGRRYDVTEQTVRSLLVYEPSERPYTRYPDEMDARTRHRAGRLMRDYGITLEQYDEILEAQNGVCAICKELPNNDRSFHVDHCDEGIRGLLCANCNHAIGKLKHDPEIIRHAAEYLDEGYWEW